MSEVRVRRSPVLIALLGVTLVGAGLGGCSTNLGNLSELTVADFNPLKGNDPFRASDYNYFYKGEVAKTGPVTAADLVGPDGRCAFAPAPEPVMAGPAPGPVAGPAPMPGPAPAAAPPPPPAQEPVAAAPASDPINPRSNSALYFTAGPQSGPVTAPGGPGSGLPPEVRNGPRGISLAMTECQVMSIAGYTDRVEIGANPRGERTVTLTYLSGDRPGIYHFRAGRLMSMERVAEVAPPPKKPVKAAKAAKKKKPPQPPQ